jgi:hypothetical protein
VSVGPASGIAEAIALVIALQRPDLSDVLASENARLVAIAQVYPPERAGQRYIRTDTLKSNWKPIAPRRAEGGWIAGAENDTDYGEYVMGDEQANVHQGRWRTVDAIAEAEEANVASAIEAEIYRLAGV